MIARLTAAVFCLAIFSALEVEAEDGTSVFIDDTHLTELSKADPATVTDLQIIDASRQKIDDEMLDKIERFQEVTTLTLSCPKLTDKALLHIAKLKQLERLLIYEGGMTDRGLQELKGLSKLKVVGLHSTPVTEAGIAELKSTLKDTYFEIGSFGKSGVLFDANGCIRPRIMYASSPLAAAEKAKLPAPAFKASLVCFNGKDGSGSNCRLASLAQFGRGPRIVTGKLTCGHKGAVSEITWTYKGQRDGQDLYHVVRRFPSDTDDPTTTEKDVKFDGKRQVLFEDESQCIVIEPPPEKK